MTPRLTMYRVEAFAYLGDPSPLIDLIPAFTVSQARELALRWHPHAVCLQLSTVTEPHACPLMVELFPNSWRLHIEIVRRLGEHLSRRVTFVAHHTSPVPTNYACVPTIDWRAGHPVVLNCDPERLPS